MKSHLRSLASALGIWLAIFSSASAAPIPGLYNTGTSDSGALLASGTVDPHYTMPVSPDASAPGPAAYVLNDSGFPIPPWLANGPTSKWIAPMASQSSGNQPGDYRFRFVFTLAGLEPGTAILTGRWASDNVGADIYLNGVPTGNPNTAQFTSWTAFTISAAQGAIFNEGTNVLEFAVNNAPPGVSPVGVRVEISGTADLALPPGTPPSITSQPTSQSVGRFDPATFRVGATGSRPLSYQWRKNGTPISGATNNTYSVPSTSSADAGNYDVVVSNAAGTVTSQTVSLNVVYLTPAQLTYEGAGPSSRRTGLAFTEIMYHPVTRADGRNLEFIEIYNSNPFREDISGYYFSGDIAYRFPTNTYIDGLNHIVVAAVTADMQSTYGLSNRLFGPFTGALPNGSGTVKLHKKSGAIVLETVYSDSTPWPIAADGTGHSLVLSRPSYGEGNPEAWSASAQVGGSPGAPDPVPTGPLENIAINEVAANLINGEEDFIELFNRSGEATDISGAWLSDRPGTNRFQIPSGTVVPAYGFVAFGATQMGFGIGASGETVYFVNPAGDRVVDVVRSGGQAPGISWGRYPDGSAFLTTGERTRGTTNRTDRGANGRFTQTGLMRAPVVINEVLYKPLAGDVAEFVELYNAGTNSLSLAGWRLQDAVSYTFPSNAVIAAGGYVVVAASKTWMQTNYPGLSSAVLYGDWNGKLANSGERLALERPAPSVSSTNNQTVYALVDEVDYRAGGRWGDLADGQGSSLELRDPRSPTRLAPEWAGSSEASKSTWTTIETTGVLDLNNPGVASADQLQIILLGAGEVLIDNVEVVPTGSANRIPNPNFESGLTGWFFQGTHRGTYWETNGGFNSSKSLHLVASDRGDHVVNRVRAPLSSVIPAGGTATIRAQVKWLRGHPEILIRLKGGHLEASGRLNVPNNVGTPGAQNSQWTANAGPAITDVSHRPVLPQAGQNIRVTARVSDPDGLAAVTLKYRIDPSAQVQSVPMVDDGTGVDAAPGDGIFTGVIPAQANGAMVAFRVEARDAAGVPAISQFPTDAPARELLVRVGESVPAGAFGTYRFWITQATYNEWSNREKMSNETLDSTFVYGTNRVVYNVGAAFSGSPYTSPGYSTPNGNLSAYDLRFPDDEPMLGDNHISLDWPVRDSTDQREQLMFWFLEQYGLPNNYRRYVHLFVNGVRRGTIYDDVQQPDGDMIEEWFPNDSEGSLWKTDFWHEFTDTGSRIDPAQPNTLQVFTSSGVKKVARYRWGWKPRSTKGSANDFTDLFRLVDALNVAGNGYIQAVKDEVDVENWMRTFAMNDLASFWDAFGNPNYKNTYLYKPERDGWKLMSWDFDVGLGVFNDPVDAPLFPSNIDPTIARMYNTPELVRPYWRAMDEALSTFFRAGAGTGVDAVLDAKYAAFQTNGVSLAAPDSIKTWINQRRNFLLGQLATVASSFAVTSPTTSTSAVNIATISGTAPVTVARLIVNGRTYPVTWVTVNSWRIQVPLSTGQNTLTVQGLDGAGSPIAGTSATVTVHYTGVVESPVGQVVINEILYSPTVTNASFIEIINTSSNYTFDVSGWRVNGVDYTFPPGTLLTNGQIVVLVQSRSAFAAAFGYDVPVFAEFGGRLDPDGETITLLRPGTNGAPDLVVNRVTYDAAPPWPQARLDGTSLQLIDPLQDNRRVANWSSGVTWRYASFTGNNTTTRLLMFLDGAGDLYVDDLQLVAGNEAGVGENVIRNGDFEGPLTTAQGGPWVLPSNMAGSSISTSVKRSGNGSLHIVATAPGGASGNSIYQDTLPITTNAVHTLSFWYLPTTRATNLTIRTGSFLRPVFNVRPQLASPGVANTTGRTLAAMPDLWINEVLPENVNGPLDNAGERDPWIELYNAGTTAVNIGGFYLANNYTNLNSWAFPANTTIAPGAFLLVWADGQPGQSVGGELHTNFRLNPTNGSVALSRPSSGGVQVLDYLNYQLVRAGQSWGGETEGGPFGRRALDQPTPAGANNAATPPVLVRINEWMADNTTYADPADGRFDDWFELYNAGTEAVNLAGYRLVNSTNNTGGAVIPNGFIIPARGFLLIWADSEPTQTTNGSLHVSFKLSKAGEVIGLHAPDGSLVDRVTFDAQTSNVSQGSYPDGSPAPYVFMHTPTPGTSNRADLAAGPRFTGAVISNGGPRLNWSATPGEVFRVEYRTNVVEGTWQALSGEITATNSTVSFADPSFSGQTQRFYRLVKVR